MAQGFAGFFIPKIFQSDRASPVFLHIIPKFFRGALHLPHLRIHVLLAGASVTVRLAEEGYAAVLFQKRKYLFLFDIAVHLDFQGL